MRFDRPSWFEGGKQQLFHSGMCLNCLPGPQVNRRVGCKHCQKKEKKKHVEILHDISEIQIFYEQHQREHNTAAYVHPVYPNPTSDTEMKSCLCKVFSNSAARKNSADINTEDGCSLCHILTDLVRSHNAAPGFEATVDILVGCYSVSQPAAMVCRSLCVLNPVLFF